MILLHPNNWDSNDHNHHDDHNDHNETTKKRRRIFVRLPNLFKNFRPEKKGFLQKQRKRAYMGNRGARFSKSRRQTNKPKYIRNYATCGLIFDSDVRRHQSLSSFAENLFLFRSFRLTKKKLHLDCKKFRTVIYRHDLLI